ncbi:MAG: hypothetical protein ACRC8S_23090 [Fimbriiglobus sp.]
MNQRTTVDLHPYDNVERRFHHTDCKQDLGREVVAQVLRLPEPPAGELLYDLSFFSGGTGVFDRLAITITADASLWLRLTSSLHARTLEEAEADMPWAGELIWLFTLEEEAAPLRPAAVRFINQHRREFQAECVPSSRILFGSDSNVNDWTALWGDDTQLNILGYSQG